MVINPPVRIRLAIPSDESAICACVEDASRLYLGRMPTPPAPLLDDHRELMWPEVDHLYVDDIAVTPGAQGQGVAKRLLERADDFARMRGRSEIRLYTNEAMTENLDYYPRRGFVETHRAVDSGYRRVHFKRHLPSLQ